MFIGQCSCAFPAERLCEGRPPGLSHLSTSLCSGSGSPVGGPGSGAGAGTGPGSALPAEDCPWEHGGSCLSPWRYACLSALLSQHLFANKESEAQRGGDSPADTEKVELVPRWDAIPSCAFALWAALWGGGLRGALPATLTLPGRAPSIRKGLSPLPWELRSALGAQPVSLPPRAVVPAPTSVRPPGSLYRVASCSP